MLVAACDAQGGCEGVEGGEGAAVRQGGSRIVKYKHEAHLLPRGQAAEGGGGAAGGVVLALQQQVVTRVHLSTH